MKKAVFGMAICCLLSFTVTAQEVSSIKNFWKETYLNTEGGMLQSSTVSVDSESAQWQFIDAGNGFYRIKNLRDGTFLNIEENNLKSSPVQNGWRSALWTLENTGGSLWTLENTGGRDLIRIRSVWKPKLYINQENGLACTKIKVGWNSAMWKIDGLNTTTNQQGNATSSTSPTTTTDQETNSLSNNYFNKQLALEVHNKLRRDVGVAPLVWDDRLAKIAQKWADKVALKNRGEDYFLEHSPRNGLGENIAGGHVNGDRPEQRILKGWGENEIVNFNKDTRKCYQGKNCGHYTQIVWRKTTRVGCAVTVNENGKYILVCNYDPQGNMNNGRAY